MLACQFHLTFPSIKRGDAVGFVDREEKRVVAKLQAGPLTDDERSQLYAVQQALLRVLEPDCFKAPNDMVVHATGIPAGLEGCLAENGRSASLDNLDHRDC